MRSGLALRLGLSGILLLSSAGLAVAASLLLYAAANNTPARLEWKAVVPTGATYFAVNPSAAATALAIPLAKPAPAEQPYYAFADYLNYRQPAGSQPLAALSEPEAETTLASPAAMSTVKTTVQRAWTTIKLAFR